MSRAMAEKRRIEEEAMDSPFALTGIGGGRIDIGGGAAPVPDSWSRRDLVGTWLRGSVAEG